MAGMPWKESSVGASRGDAALPGRCFWSTGRFQCKEDDELQHERPIKAGSQSGLRPDSAEEDVAVVGDHELVVLGVVLDVVIHS